MAGTYDQLRRDVVQQIDTWKRDTQFWRLSYAAVALITIFVPVVIAGGQTLPFPALVTAVLSVCVAAAAAADKAWHPGRLWDAYEADLDTCEDLRRRMSHNPGDQDFAKFNTEFRELVDTHRKRRGNFTAPADTSSAPSAPTPQ